MPRQIEPNANNALGDMLRGMTPDCEVRSENTHTISLGWGHKVCWKKLDVVFNPAPSGK